MKEYLETKKNIRDNLLSERTGQQQLQTDLSKFYKPITETQKATREITEGLRPIRQGIENLLHAITFPAYPSIQAVDEPPEGEKDAPDLGDIVQKYLRKFATRSEADTTYWLYDRGGKFYIGNKLAFIVDNEIVIGKDEYDGMPGLWELIVSKEPKEFTTEDYNNYAKLMVKTNALYRDNNPEKNTQKAVKVINGLKYLKTFGIIGKSIKEVGLLSFQAILTH